MAEAAITEGMASSGKVPTDELERLDSLWSKGGADLLLSGNIQIDSDLLERTENVVVDRAADRTIPGCDLRSSGSKE